MIISSAAEKKSWTQNWLNILCAHALRKKKHDMRLFESIEFINNT